MKKLLTSTLFALLALSLTHAQMVNPNKPFTTLSSDPGWASLTEIAVGFGLGDTKPDFSGSFVGLTEIGQFQFTKSMVAGLGTGVLFYNGGTLVPLFMDFRYRFNVKSITPYLFGQGGTLLNFSDFESSKVFLTGGGGGQYAFSSRMAANLGVGLMIQSESSRDSFITLRGGFTYMF